MMENNLELDYQTIVIKKEKAEDIIKKYECFGWVKLKEKQHPQYENLLEVVFSRPHKIANKDALQFLQVNMEVNIINQGRLEKTKHSKSLSLCLSLAFISLVCIVNAVLAILYMRPLNKIIVGSLFAIVGLTSLILIPIFLTKLLKKEKQEYQEKSKEYNNSIDNIVNKAREFMEVKNEKDNH